MLVLVGESASGKDYIKQTLIEEYGFKPMITYTSRPMREGEKQHSTYHFISEEDFKKKINEHFFAEWKKYKTVEGTWYYGTALEDCHRADADTIAILAPDGVRDLQDKNIKIYVIYIYANLRTRMQRLSLRGDNQEEANRRIKADEYDFQGVEVLADHITRNHFNDNIYDVTDDIIDAYNSYLM